MDRIIQGDSLEMLRELPTESVNCVVTSPPYWGLRDYGVEGQLGLETSLEEYLEHMVDVFREVRRVLRTDGTLWLNLGDSYVNDTKWGGSGSGPTSKNYTSGLGGYVGQKAKRHTGLKPKDLAGIPWRVALALQDDGWYLRSDIIWHKSNAMPDPARDRPGKAHEYLFLFSRSPRYFYDGNSVRDDYSRSVWTIPTYPFPESHFSTMPPALVEPCILAGCPTGGIVLDPFGGSGTVGVVARLHSRHYILIELNPAYCEMAERRILRESRQPVLWSAVGKEAI